MEELQGLFHSVDKCYPTIVRVKALQLLVRVYLVGFDINTLILKLQQLSRIMIWFWHSEQLNFAQRRLQTSDITLDKRNFCI